MIRFNFTQLTPLFQTSLSPLHSFFLVSFMFVKWQISTCKRFRIKVKFSVSFSGKKVTSEKSYRSWDHEVLRGIWLQVFNKSLRKFCVTGLILKKTYTGSLIWISILLFNNKYGYLHMSWFIWIFNFQSSELVIRYLKLIYSYIDIVISV